MQERRAKVADVAGKAGPAVADDRCHEAFWTQKHGELLTKLQAKADKAIADAFEEGAILPEENTATARRKRKIATIQAILNDMEHIRKRTLRQKALQPAAAKKIEFTTKAVYFDS